MCLSQCYCLNKGMITTKSHTVSQKTFKKDNPKKDKPLPNYRTDIWQNQPNEVTITTL